MTVVVRIRNVAESRGIYPTTQGLVSEGQGPEGGHVARNENRDGLFKERKHF